METDKSEVRSQEVSAEPTYVERLTRDDGPEAPGKTPTQEMISPTPEPLLYDADAQQLIPFKVEHEGETIRVAYKMDAQTDDAIAEYDRLTNERYLAADEEETGQQNAMETVDERDRAAVWLLNDRLLDVEGFGAEGEEKPDSWKELVFDDDRDRVAVIDNAYLAAQPVPAPLATPGKRLPWNRPVKKTAIHLLALFNGHQLRLMHERTSKPTAEQITEFKSIKKSRYLVQGTKLGQGEIRVPPKARRLAALYDSLGYETTGYAGRVPLHHKAIVVTQDLGKEAEAVRKN